MRSIPKEEVLRRLKTENPWWEEQPNASGVSQLKRRAYFELLYPLVTDLSVRRAVLLLGPRRVGKTVLIHHVIEQLIDDGADPKRICYVSVDHPLYNDCSLEDLLAHYREATGVEPNAAPSFVFFDEIQYLRNWETHLKALVDDRTNTSRVLASGSAAAALKLKSAESGAGRFTDFLLPPLTFYEYTSLLGKDDLVTIKQDGERFREFASNDIEALNSAFVHYLNFGGYPEVIFSETIQRDLARFIKSDIIDKVLLRDLPSLYGIQDIQELNALFTSLAFNSANEVSLEELSKNSGVAKNTIKRYIEYLEAAFLIKSIHRIDRAGKRFQRANFFKVYLTNPSLRSALFSPIGPDDLAMGSLTETGIFSQWFHSRGDTSLRYARWQGGEVDIVGMNAERPHWAVEVKWTDRYFEKPNELDGLISFAVDNGIAAVGVTTRSIQSRQLMRDVVVDFQPASLYCYMLGHNIIHARRQQQLMPVTLLDDYTNIDDAGN